MERTWIEFSYDTMMYGGPGGHSMCHVTSDSTYVLKGDLYVLIECDYDR